MKALEYALSLLSRSDKTSRQLFDALIKKGFSKEEAEEALERVKDYGYVNDSAYAKRFVENNSSFKGRRRMKADLTAKGISEEDLNLALEEITDEDEEQAAFALAEKRFRGKDRDGAKIFRFLAYRGFSQGVIYKVIRRLNVTDEICE